MALTFPTSPTLDQVYTASNGQDYFWNGTSWIAQSTFGGTSGYESNLPDLSDVVITNPSEGDILSRSGSTWVNAPASTLLTTALLQGKHSMWIPAGAMYPRTTAGATAGTYETATNKVMLKSMNFATSPNQYAQFAIKMPKSWNEGTLTAKFTWCHASTGDDFKVSWGLRALALSNTDDIEAAFGSEVVANVEGGTTDMLYVSAETAPLTVAGVITEEDYVIFQVERRTTDITNDTMGIDARLLGVTIYWISNSQNDN